MFCTRSKVVKLAGWLAQLGLAWLAGLAGPAGPGWAGLAGPAGPGWAGLAGPAGPGLVGLAGLAAVAWKRTGGGLARFYYPGTILELSRI